MRTRTKFGLSLALFGILMMVAGVAYALLVPEHWRLAFFPILTGASIAFVGFYIIEPKSALEGGGFIVNAADRLGRRKTDPQIIPAAPPVAVAPVAPVSDGVGAPSAPAPPVPSTAVDPYLDKT